jgi:hypothetical protein
LEPQYPIWRLHQDAQQMQALRRQLERPPGAFDNECRQIEMHVSTMERRLRHLPFVALDQRLTRAIRPGACK